MTIIDMSDERSRALLKNLEGPSEQRKAVEMGDVLVGILRRLDDGTSERKAAYDRLLAIENEMKKRGSRRFGRYLVAILIGVAATLAWQSYGESVKQIIATRAPELGWSPQAKQMIASWTLGWTKPPASSEKQASPVAQTAPTTPTLDPSQVQQMTQNLEALRQTTDQLAGGQDQMRRDIARLEAAVAELIAKTPEPTVQPSIVPAHKPTPPPSRTPILPRQ